MRLHSPSRYRFCLTGLRCLMTFAAFGCFVLSMELYAQVRVDSVDMLVRRLPTVSDDSCRLVYQQIARLKNADRYLSTVARLARQKELSIVYDVYNDLTEAKITMGELDSAIFYYNDVIAFARAKGSLYNVARLLNNVGTVYILQGKYGKALTSFEEALMIAREGKFELVVAATLISAADLYEKMGDYPQSLTYLVDAQRAIEHVNNNDRLVRMRSFIFNQMSIVYRQLRQNDKALAALDQALQVYANAPDMHQSTDWTDLKLQYAALLFDMKRYDDARTAYLEAQRLAEDQRYNMALVEATLGFGRTALQQSDKLLVEKSLADVEDLMETIDADRLWFQWHKLAGDLAIADRNLTTAVDEYRHALLSHPTESMQEELELTMQLAACFEQLKLADSANFYLSSAISLQRDIYDKEAAKQMNYYLIKEDLLAAELENKQLGLANELKESELIRRQSQIRIALVVAIMLLVVVFISFIAIGRIRRQNKALIVANETVARQRNEITKQNEALQERQEEIQAQNEELTLQHEQISAQRDQLEAQNRLLEESKSLIAYHNQRLERAVHERTLELAQSNENLRGQYQKIEQFNFITAHKIRGPVARILGLANLFQEDTRGDAREEYVARINKSARELDAIIHDLNDILEIQQTSTLEYEDVRLRGVIEDCLKGLELTGAEKPFSFEMHLGVERMNTVKNYLERMVAHLLTNAVKFQSETRPLAVTIQSLQVEDFILISVADNGSGFAADRLEEKLFKPFERFHPEIEGRGLGLFMVKAMITHLNGHVHISSRPDEGTLVTLSLPLRRS